jgi:hypothetical protein
VEGGKIMNKRELKVLKNIKNDLEFFMELPKEINGREDYVKYSLDKVIRLIEEKMEVK